MEVGSGSREKGMVRYWRLVIQTTALALILDLLYGQELRIGIQISIGYDPTKSLKISQTTNGRRPIKRPKSIKLQTDEAQSNARRASNLKWAKPNQTPEGHQTSNGQSPIKRPKVIKPQMGEAQSNARRASNLKWAKPNQTPEGHQTSCGRSPIKRPKGINPHVGCAHMSHLPLLITASRCSINSVSLSKYTSLALLPSPGPTTPKYSN